MAAEHAEVAAAAGGRKRRAVGLLALGHVMVVFVVEGAGGRDLFVPRRDLNLHSAAVGTRPVLERHARVPQVRVLERYHFVACNVFGKVCSIFGCLFWLIKLVA